MSAITTQTTTVVVVQSKTTVVVHATKVSVETLARVTVLAISSAIYVIGAVFTALGWVGPALMEAGREGLRLGGGDDAEG